MSEEQSHRSFSNVRESLRVRTGACISRFKNSFPTGCGGRDGAFRQEKVRAITPNVGAQPTRVKARRTVSADSTFLQFSNSPTIPPALASTTLALIIAIATATAFILA